MKRNEDLQKGKQAVIKWEPLMKMGEIGVNTKDGVINLPNIVDNFTIKSEAKNVANDASIVNRLKKI